MEKLEPSYFAEGNVRWCKHYEKVWQFLKKKLNINLPYDPAIPFLSIYPGVIKTRISQKTCRCS